MEISLNYLFKYFEEEEIEYDKSELLFQVSSNPNYPSLLAVIDTLDFLKVNNAILNIQFSELNLLPERFVALLSIENNYEHLFLVKKKGNDYIIYDEDNKRKIISSLDLEKKWKNIVFLVEKNDEIITKSNTRFNDQIILMLFALSFIGFIFTTNLNVFHLVLFVLNIIGLTLSLATLKELLSFDNKIISKFCNITESTSCTSIVNSKKWKFFELVNLSDMTVLFYTFQLVVLVYSIITNNEIYFKSFFFTVILFSTPLFIISIYYQKKIEKKWCPLCLAIIGFLIFELIYLYYNINFNRHISIDFLLNITMILLSTSLILRYIKNLLLENKKLKEYKNKALKFERNYKIFKNTLIKNPKIILPITPIILGNNQAKCIITLVTNPFCGHCKKIHDIIHDILELEENNIQVRIVIKTNLELENEKIKKFFYSLFKIHQEYGENKFNIALNYWFENKNVDEWLHKFKLSEFNTMKINALLEETNNWCIKNNYNYTPAIFINGHEYPQEFERENLIFYIKELIEDNNF